MVIGVYILEIIFTQIVFLFMQTHLILAEKILVHMILLAAPAASEAAGATEAASEASAPASAAPAA